jgi:protein translocase SecG subunit
MSLLIGFLTFILVLNCLFLILLVLIQIPKKEAGAGVAFGGGATDALFGAGSGSAISNITKYSAGFFVCLSLCLSLLNSNNAKASNRRLEEELLKKANAAPALATPAPASTTTPATPATSSAEVTELTDSAASLLTLVSNKVSAAAADAAAAVSNAAPATISIEPVPAVAPEN